MLLITGSPSVPYCRAAAEFSVSPDVPRGTWTWFRGGGREGGGSAASHHHFGWDVNTEAAGGAFVLRLAAVSSAASGCLSGTAPDTLELIASVEGEGWPAITAAGVLLRACDNTIRLWMKGHALSTSQFAIYSPYPLRLMTWAMQVEIMQITFPWKCPALCLS